MQEYSSTSFNEKSSLYITFGDEPADFSSYFPCSCCLGVLHGSEKQGQLLSVDVIALEKYPAHYPFPPKDFYTFLALETLF